MNLRFFRHYRVYSNSLKIIIKRTRIFLELCSRGPPSSLAREGKIRRRLFTSYIKRAIKHFHVLLVVKESYKKARTCKVNVGFANLNLLPF